ncbi:MAG: hypothetical protein BWY56_02627 [Acidobacteria bacterium ADurb.Bin340]|nr:MAG: hypothetical protein BWY56_02627 [Acidobacteria bacterium ADurb.Bin340]
MFSMLEKARTLAPSLWTSACQEAHRAVRAASPITVRERAYCPSTPTQEKVTRTNTSTATLEAAVASRAVTVDEDRL